MSSLVTICLFLLARLLHSRKPYLIFVPVFFSVLGCILFLKGTGMNFTQYFEENKVLTSLLGPAVVALGVLMYKQMDAIKSRLGPLLIAIACGSLASVFLVAVLAVVLKLPSELAASLLPLGITTPIAIEVSEPLGGDPAITSVVVIGIGLLGNMFSPIWLRWFRITDVGASGVAIGMVSHGIGTARAIQLHEMTGVFSGLAMCINGVVTVFTAPLMWSLFYG
ncbi:LrgB family protein [Membranicola marinus]|uniref:LrgB family protein n=1 Tax=Membranihabitans marinus TaxID=1227546 RepID=A0A953HPF8_9BACT|nr:LrgB family protein [Membranihabitans marinus]MBY5958388.1 LrgB family protein [Membranihabitans marinus]